MRQPENIIIVGAQKTGKTTFADEIIQATNRKTLIVDSDGLEKIWWKYPVIPKELLPRLSGTKEKCRIIFDEDDPQFFRRIRSNFFSGCICFDDTAFFLADRRAEQFRKIVLRNRQTNNDIILIFHGLSEVPPNFWTFASRLVLFNTTDSFERNRDSIPKYDAIRKAVYDVRQKALKNPHHKEIFFLR